MNPSKLLLLGIAISATVGCSIRYEYPAPSEAHRRELEALTAPGLTADTGRAPHELPPGPFAAALSFEHDRYFVPARVNGRAADLMLDWGSWVTVGLMPYMVRTAEARLTDELMATSTFDGEGAMRTGVIDELEIGTRRFRDVPFAMSNQDLIVTLGGMTVYRGKGMLGLAILAGYDRFAVDLAGEQLHFGTIPEALLASSDLVTVPFRADDGLWIDAVLDGVPVSLKVDIGGYAGTVLLEGAAADAFMRAHSSEFSGHTTGFGDGARERRRGRASTLTVGACTLHDVGVTLLPGEGDGGVIGHGFFGRTIVGVDWERRTLSFVPVR